MWWKALNEVKLPTVVPIVINFMPSWWHRNFGVTFGERWVMDADYRVSTLTEMMRLLYGRFGDVGLGLRDPCPQLALFNLHNATLPAVLGCEVVFPDDNYAWSHQLPIDKLGTISLPPDWTERFPVRELISQAHYLSSQYNQPVPCNWNTQGVQNVAVSTGGVQFLASYRDQPNLALHLLDTAAATIRASIHYMASVQSLPNPFIHANCTAMMVSPEHFKEWLLPYEIELYEEVTRLHTQYGIHHCGKADTYLPIYDRVPHLAWLEVGMGSDVALAQRTFPNMPVQLIVDASLMREGESHEVAQHIKDLISEAVDTKHLSLAIPDLEHGTPDENIRAAIEAAMMPSQRVT